MGRKGIDRHPRLKCNNMDVQVQPLKDRMKAKEAWVMQITENNGMRAEAMPDMHLCAKEGGHKRISTIARRAAAVARSTRHRLRTRTPECMPTTALHIGPVVGNKPTYLPS